MEIKENKRPLSVVSILLSHPVQQKQQAAVQLWGEILLKK